MPKTVGLNVMESALFMGITLALFFLTSANTALAQASRELAIDKQVAALIEKTLEAKNEEQAFSDLEGLECAAVPAIINRMDDRRKLPDPHISLRNKSTGTFEAIRQYGPQVVVDALAAILNQITGRQFGFIYNGATEVERTKTIHGWRNFLSKTPEAKLCGNI